MESNIFECLNDLGYKSIDSVDSLKNIINLKENLVEYSKLVAWLTNELSNVSKVDEKVHEIDSIDDLATFSLEINSLLKELRCPYKSINEFSNESISERFKSTQNKALLLSYLCGELEAGSIVAANKPEQQQQQQQSRQVDEFSETIALKKMLISLGFPKPPANITWAQIWQRVGTRVTELLSKLPQNYLGKPVLNVNLSDKQWNLLIKINQMLNDDFKLRKEMLLKRLDVTVQSFKWADSLKGKSDEISKIYYQNRKDINSNANITIADLLAARDDICNQEKTCSTRLMQPTRLHKIIIPNVPDRGGRTGELQPPPPEMPAFMQRQQQQQHQQHQPQRQQRVQSGYGGSGKQYDSTPKWSNPQQQQQDYRGNGGGGGYYQQPQQQAYGGGGGYQQQNYNDNQYNNYRPQSDFERFQNQDYEGGGGKRYHQGEDSRNKSARGGGRGGGRGGRGGGNRY